MNVQQVVLGSGKVVKETEHTQELHAKLELIELCYSGMVLENS